MRITKIFLLFCICFFGWQLQSGGGYNYGNGMSNQVPPFPGQQSAPAFQGQQSPAFSGQGQSPAFHSAAGQQSPRFPPEPFPSFPSAQGQQFPPASPNSADQQQQSLVFDDAPPFPGQPFSGQQSRPAPGTDQSNGQQSSSVAQNSRFAPISRLHNWGGNFRFSTQNIEYPRTTEEVQQIVRRARKCRVLGSRHSFSRIADSRDTLISTLGMNNIVSVNPRVPSVTVQPGMTYTDLCPFLHSLGLALPNLASLGEISIGGAISTGVHGSGMALPNLASHLLSMELVMANGSVGTFRRGDTQWNGLAVGLGAFGVMTKVELQLVPAFGVATYVFLNMPLDNLFNNFNQIMAVGYSVQLLSTMANPNVLDQIWIIVRPASDPNNVGQMTSLFGATRATQQVTPNAVLPATYLIDQGIQLPWYEGLTEYKMGFSGADGNEIQTEWLVPFSSAVPALKALASMSAELAPLIYLWDIRTIKVDQFWMSPSSSSGNGRDTVQVAIHFTWKPSMAAVMTMLPKVEAALAPFNPRPHWGKVFTLAPSQFLRTYPNAQRFVQMANQFDPTGKFRNEFLEQNVFRR